MKIVLQRVKKAAVRVDGEEKASIGKGLLLLVGIGREDTPETVEHMAGKISRLRVFEDTGGKMNLDISQVSGEILSVSQFTLLADIAKGNRPGFDEAAPPEIARKYWEGFNGSIRRRGIPLKEGEFGARMDVSLVNDGPVTIVIDRAKN
ncbi:MAG: D-tyrosyl-tRNA(Tyr) deacylase [Candidatus Omnitrophica bacterium]|nr:D-tyrosyl-tRNA(Tyr) deacylase [Candidatus Omnitrophota bacterium]